MNIIRKILNVNTFIEKNQKLEKEVSSLENRNGVLKEKINEYDKEINMLRDNNKEIGSELKESKYLCDVHFQKSKSFKKEIINIMEKVIIDLVNEKINNDNYKKIYNIISQFDKKGFILYRTAENMTGIDVSKEFPAEENMGYFECGTGYDCLKYLEAFKFGQLHYTFSGMYEILSDYEIDYNSSEYQDFKDDLYYLTIINILEDIENRPAKYFGYPEEKFDFPLHNIIVELINL